MGLSGSSGWGLAVDYGTSFTAAAVFDGAGVEVLEVEDSPRFPSAVLLADDGSLLTGRAALNQARRHPDRYERTPKRLVGQPATLLGGRAVEVVAMVGAVLTRVVGAARVRQGSSSPAWVRLTHPAGWGPERCEVLRTAAARAGLERVEFLSEPEAAAWFFVEDRRGEEPVVGEGGCVAIYDLGGGTFDTAILRREASGFRLAGPPGGLDWFGGEDFDQRLYDWVLGRVYELNPAVWRELSEPRSPGWRRARLQLREDVRQAKEALSTTNTVSVPVAAGGDDVLDVTVTRLDFERLIRDDLEGTVGVLEKTARDAGVSREEIAAVYLTGGSSRVPLAGALASRFHPRTYTRPDPKTLVVRGAIAGHLAAQARPVAVEPPVAGPEPVVAPAGPVREPGVSMPEPAAAPPAETRAPEPQAAAPAGAPPGLPAWLVRDGRPRPVALGLVALAVLVLASVAFAALGGGSEAPALEITASEYVAGRAGLARVVGTVDPAGARVRVQGRSVQVRDGRWRTTARVGSGERVRVVASGPEGSVTEMVPVSAPRLAGTWIVTQSDEFASDVLGGRVERARAEWRFRPVCQDGRCTAAVLAFPSPGGATRIRLRRRGASYFGSRAYTLPRSGTCLGRPYASRWTTRIELTVTASKGGDPPRATRFRGVARHRSRPPAFVPCPGGRLVTRLNGRPA